MTVVSVIIPAYNAEDTIVDVVRMCLAQKLSIEVEVIVVDDVSKDNTAYRVSKEFCTDSRVKLISMESNGGPGMARNAAIPHITGEYTVFLDADDYIDMRCVERIIFDMRKYDIDVAISGYQELDSYSKFNGDKITGDLLPSDKRIYQSILQGSQKRIFNLKHYPRVLEIINFPWNKVYLTSFVREKSIKFPNLRLNEDILPHWMSLCFANKIMMCDEVMVTHIVPPHGNNATNQSSMQRMDAVCAIDQLSTFLSSREVPEYVIFSFLAFSVDFLSWAKNLIPLEAREDFRERLVDVYSRYRISTIIRADTSGYNVIAPLHALIYR